jgi:hypothetical protein
MKERARWGKKDKGSPSEWDKVDSQNILKGLQTYGYGRIPWDDFCRKVGVKSSKYNEFEVSSESPFVLTNTSIEPAFTMFLQVKRMCWSLVLMTIREAADDDVLASKRKAEKAAEKKREAEGKDESLEGGILGNNAPPVQPLENLDSCFEKLWKTHKAWIEEAVGHAQEFAASHPPRPKQTLDRALHVGTPRNQTESMKGVNAVFVENVWPALRSRGWKVEMSPTDEGDVTKYAFGDKKVSTRRRLDSGFSPMQSTNIPLARCCFLSLLVRLDSRCPD